MTFEPRRGDPVGRRWTDADGPHASDVWSALDADRQWFFTPLIDNPGEPLTAEELGRTFVPPREARTIPALLAVPGRLCKERGLDYFWNCSYLNSGSGRYSVSRLVADLFTRGRAPGLVGRPVSAEAVRRFEGDVSCRDEVERRREQSDVRRLLLGRGRTARCSLCEAEFPVRFLHAAHIKPRYACTDHERRDIAHVAMLLCVFGCDALFEAGLVVVGDDGTILTRRCGGTGPVADRLIALSGRTCIRHDAATADYFRWHREKHWSVQEPLIGPPRA